MRHSALVRRNVGESIRRFLPLLLALMVGVVALLITSGAIGQAVSQSASALDTASALTVLRLDSVNPSGPSQPLTDSVVRTIGQIKGVEDVRPYAQFALAVPGSGGTGADAFWATPQVPWVQPRLTRTVPGLTMSHRLAAEEIYLPDAHSGVDDRQLLGKRLRVQYTRATGPAQGESAELVVRVVGLYDNSHPGADGESAAYVGDVLFATLLKAQLGLPPAAALPRGFGYPTVYVKASSTQATAGVQSALVALGYPADSPAAQAKELPGLLQLAARLNLVLGAGLSLFCLGIGLSLGGTWSALRRWDVGVLTSLGWSRKRILGAYMAEILWIGTGVAATSMALGCLGSGALGFLLEGRTLLGATFGQGLALPAPRWVAAVGIGTPLALVLGSAPRVIRLASVPPDIALRRRD